MSTAAKAATAGFVIAVLALALPPALPAIQIPGVVGLALNAFLFGRLYERRGK